MAHAALIDFVGVTSMIDTLRYGLMYGHKHFLICIREFNEINIYLKVEFKSVTLSYLLNIVGGAICIHIK